MAVRIHIPPFMEHLTGEVKVVIVKGKSVGDCLTDLVFQFPRLETELFTTDGSLNKSLTIFVNGKTAYPEELQRQVKDGDSLHILNVVTGG